MSLFALYKNSAAPGRVAIDDALAGNLCRCTGYRPIVDSARTMYSHAPATTDDWRLAPAGVDAGVSERVAALEAMQGEAMLAIEHDRRRFFAPRSAAELAECCARHPDATLLAGGTDVGLWVTKQLRELTTVVYTGRVAELHALDEVDGMLSIGAAVSLSDAMPVIVRHFPTLEELLLRFASPPIRNAGTLGGNVANGSPIGDSMPALLAIDTVVRLRSREGSRDLPLSDFYLDYQETALLPGEFVEQVVMPLLQPDEHLRSYKVSKRFDQDISAVCGAFRVRLDDRLRIDDVRIAYGGLAATPKRATACEQALIGREFVEAGIADAMDALDDDFEPISDMRASDEYRRRISRNLLLRFYRETAAELDGKPIVRIYDYGRQKRA